MLDLSQKLSKNPKLHLMKTNHLNNQNFIQHKWIKLGNKKKNRGSKHLMPTRPTDVEMNDDQK